MKRVRACILVTVCFCSLNSFAQSIVTGTVVDVESKIPIVGAVVVQEDNSNVRSVTNNEGFFTLNISVGKGIIISHLGYDKQRATARPKAVYYLRSATNEMREVVVTAQEAKGLTAASTIGKRAMEHLQPSSFSDILELLPGGRASDPELTTPNAIHLREAVPNNSDNYTTSSLGTSFVVDGAPISTNTNMQHLSGSWEPIATYRDFTNRGVDMRSISTDDIEKVEIVRGIPSVEYGDLTSGLVKIDRKKGGNDINARLKADMDSKLFYLSKGFEWKNKTTLNLSIDYLDAKEDPRNALENYHRLTLSARYGKRWQTKKYALNLFSNLDYTGSFDKEKSDPDLSNGRIDKYKSSYNRAAFMTVLNLTMRRKMWFRSLDFTFSTSYAHDVMSRTRLIQLSRMTPATITTTEGESNAVILPYTYYGTQEADGKPFNIYIKLKAKFRVPSQKISNTLLIGSDWNLDKNYGKGQVFDGLHPLYPETSARPRKLSATPAMSTLSFYAEENIKIPLGENRLELVAGLRTGQMLNLPSEYTMRGKWYWDPRMNIGWNFPKFTIANLPTHIRISAGVGQHTKNPTMSYLYPVPNYLDIVQMNYYHSVPAYRAINLMTYVIDPSNPSLKPARNLKWEVGTDITIGGNRLSVTYFKERMKSGFRTNTIYRPYTYKVYDVSGIDANTITAAPDVATLPYRIVQQLFAQTEYGNGSRTDKQGIEYTFSSVRIPSIHTRITINGAWFKTTYRNSQEVMYRPSAVINNRQIGYVGLYKDNDGLENEMANTNFTFDTDIPRLKLGFSVSAQCLWFTSSQRLPLSNIPDKYMTPDGDIKDWQSGDENDTYLRFLVRNHTDAEYRRYTEPFSMNINLKVNKRLLNDRLNVAMFCNRILDITPDYERDGKVIRRHVKPYFGLEMNVKL